MMITNILKRASALVVAFFLIACTSQSYEATVASTNQAVVEAACPAKTLTELSKAIGDAGGVVDKTYKGSEAQAIIKVFNSIPPASDHKGDTVTVFRKGPLGAIVISAAGCVVHAEQGPYIVIMQSTVLPALKGNV